MKSELTKKIENEINDREYQIVMTDNNMLTIMKRNRGKITAYEKIQLETDIEYCGGTATEYREGKQLLGMSFPK